MVTKKLLQNFVAAINSYDGSPEAQEKLKNYLCYIAENKKQIESGFPIDELINTASTKMKAFGFSVLNNTFHNEASSEICAIADESIKSYHKAQLQNEKQEIILDGMQKQIIEKYQSLENKRVMLSAPTSFGKTFILQEILALNAEEYKNVMIILPTIALLNENARKYQGLIKRGKLNYKLITTNYEELSPDRNLLIFTPERALKFLGVHTTEPKLDFFFFDEVYKIEDKVKETESEKDRRAVAFRTCLYHLAKQAKDFYIAGPYINIENKKNVGLAKFCSKHKVSICQVTFDPTFRIFYEAWTPAKITEDNQLLDNSKSHNIKIENSHIGTLLKRVKWFIDNNALGKSIFYISSPNKISKYIKEAEILAPKKVITSELESFIGHLKHRYDYTEKYSSADYWTLIKSLESGIGIHHGKLPRYIQNEILRMFIDERSDLDHLFCTSTIIEGVNTAAKNVVMVSNSLGRGETQLFAFKNIRGRAGRYYHNFVGRLFYCKSEQKKMNQNNEYMNIEFINYADIKLSSIDIDNTDMEDLSEENKAKKKAREDRFNKTLLPDEVFAQNRLFDRFAQEKILGKILEDDTFDRLFLFVNEVIKRDKDFQDLLKEILDVEKEFIFTPAKTAQTPKEIVESLSAQAGRVLTVVKTYLERGFIGLLSWQIKSKSSLDEQQSKMDECYNEAFKELRETIEFEVPKYISLFQSLFYRACQVKKKEMGQLPLEDFVKEFEIGKASEFGRLLLERGYPREATTEIDKRLRKAIRDNGLELDNNDKSIEYILANKEAMLEGLDGFEKALFLRIVE